MEPGNNEPQHQDDDCGWDESETLADRVRKMGGWDQFRQAESPREGTPASSTVSKGKDDGNDRGDSNRDANTEGSEKRQPQRPNIWKELENNPRARGGGGGGMHRGKTSMAPRFQHADQFSSNRQGNFDHPAAGPRFGDARDRNADRHGGRGHAREFRDSRWDGGRSRNEDNSHGDVVSAKGFGREEPRSTHQKEPALSRESPAYRSLQATVRGGGFVMGRSGPSHGSSRREERGATTTKKSFLDREQEDDVEKEQYAEDHGQLMKADRHYKESRQGRSRKEYAEGDFRSKEMDKNAFWLVDADDRDMVSGYNRSQKQRATESGDSPTFEPIRKALDNFDHSSRSTKQILGLLMNVADSSCENDNDRWLKLIDQYLLAYAVDEGGEYVELVCAFFGRCISRPAFQKASYISLSRYISNLMTPHEWTEKDHRDAANLCDLFGRLLIFTWPSGWDSCAKECNMISYAVMNAVQTWIRALDKAVIRDTPIREEVAEVSAICLWHVATATGRKLWLKWPDLIDQMYSTIKSVIVSRSCPLHEDTKTKLLDLYIKLNEWPKSSSHLPPRNLPKRDAVTQTDRQVEGYPTPSVQQWMPQASAFEVVTPSGFIPGQFSVPPPPLPFRTQPEYATPAVQLQQETQRLPGFRGAYQPQARTRSYLGPMGKH